MIKIRRILTEDIDNIFNIRDSVKENYLSIEELNDQGFTVDLLRQMLLTNCIGWILLIDDYPVGFIIIDIVENRVLGLFIRDTFKGKGFGKTLIHEAEKWFIDQGVNEIWLCTPSDPSTRAHKFYKSLSWKESGIMTNGQTRYTKKLVNK